jgi:hypothetical protein
VPKEYDDKVSYPKKISKLKDGQDGYSLFLSIDAKFAKSSEKPSQVYVSLKKQPSVDSVNLAVNSYGSLDSKSGLYDIQFNFEKELVEHLNGIYDIEIHAADIRADSKNVWQLGQI